MKFSDSFNHVELENDRLRHELEELREERRSEMEQARKERKEAAREAMCHAESWVDAFNKGLERYKQEAAEETATLEKLKDDPELAQYANDPFFSEMVPKIERARAIYLEEMIKIDEAIRRMRQAARYTIANFIEEEFANDNAMKELAEALRDDNHDWLVDW